MILLVISLTFGKNLSCDHLHCWKLPSFLHSFNSINYFTSFEVLKITLGANWDESKVKWGREVSALSH